MVSRPVLPFVPYAVVAVVHLATLAVHDSSLATVSKWFLMPALLVAVLITCRRPAGRPVGLIVLAVAFSWGGDVLLGMPGDLGFLIGLGSFFLAHVTYTVLFIRRLRIRRMPRLVVALFGLWWVALLIVLSPHLGALLVPVAVYGLVLGASATASLASTPWVATGGVLFLVSDTILAFKLFFPGFSLWQADFIIMLLYLAAQGFIVFGATRTFSRAQRPAVVSV